MFLNNPNFQYYLNTAFLFGFSVNHLNPGVLVSDLESPQFAHYRNHFQMTNLNEIFTNQYEKTLYSDLTFLTKWLVEAWNGFVGEYPLRRTIKVSKNVSFSNIHRLSMLNVEQINNNIYNKIIKLYITIRNIEERQPYTTSSLNRLINNAIRIQKISERKMLDYIDDQFKSKYNLKKGSLTYHSKRNQLRLDK